MLSTVILAFGCETESRYDPLDDYQEFDAETIFDAPDIDLEAVALDSRDAVVHRKDMIESLGCGVCHTDGPIAGSRIGIAYINPLKYVLPDVELGFGRMSDRQIIAAKCAGKGRHGERLGLVMPWGGYALIFDDDTNEIVAYLRNIEPICHRVRTNIAPGMPVPERYVNSTCTENVCMLSADTSRKS